MNIEMIVIVILVIAIIWMFLHFQGRLSILEYRLLLTTEALAEMEGSKESLLVAKQARDEINKKHFLLDKIVQNS